VQFFKRLSRVDFGATFHKGRSPGAQHRLWDAPLVTQALARGADSHRRAVNSIFERPLDCEPALLAPFAVTKASDVVADCIIEGPNHSTDMYRRTPKDFSALNAAFKEALVSGTVNASFGADLCCARR
jgi:hypothetical protein